MHCVITVWIERRSCHVLYDSLQWRQTRERHRCWCHTYKHAANGCWFRPIARWTDYCHCGPQYEISIFHTGYEYQIYPLSSAVRMLNVQINISNRTLQSGVLLQAVTVTQLVKKLPVNYATWRSIPCLQDPAALRCSEPDESCPHLRPVS